MSQTSTPERSERHRLAARARWGPRRWVDLAQLEAVNPTLADTVRQLVDAAEKVKTGAS